MRRRALLAAPLALPLLAPGGAPAAAQEAASDAPARPVMEEFTIPAREEGISLYLRNKRPAGGAAPRPDRTILMVHGATYPSHTGFDLPLGGVSWMDYLAGRGFDAWCLDLRGYGRSTRPAALDRPAADAPPATTADEALADVAAAADFIRGRRGVARLNLLGWSWGTTLVGRYAAENPQLVERLVLYAPLWLSSGPGPIPIGGTLGAYRTVAKDAARDRWLRGVPAAKRDGVIPPGWFEHWSDATWATDPEGSRRSPPILRAPNGVLKDIQENWTAGRPTYDPARIAAPTLLAVGEWDQDTPPAQAVALFPLLVNAPVKRLVLLGEGTHSIMLERNRGALLQAVQVFLEEGMG